MGIIFEQYSGQNNTDLLGFYKDVKNILVVRSLELSQNKDNESIGNIQDSDDVVRSIDFCPFFLVPVIVVS